MSDSLYELLVCPKCQHRLDAGHNDDLICANCGYSARVLDGKPIFTDVPATIEPWEKVERGPDQGTAWRRSNWKFLNELVKAMPKNALILDVGAGHGDFADIFAGKNYYSLDIVPYAEVDLVCDLGQTIPFMPDTFDAVVLMNVLEHVFENRGLIKNISKIIKPGGKVIITVPFLLKVHQAPFDFSRYTPYYLAATAEEVGFKVTTLCGYYDTLYLLNESLGNLWQYSIQSRPPLQRFLARGLVFVIQRLINLLGKFSEKGAIRPFQEEKNPAPVGYLVVLEKKA
ncbi:MAG: methyltransferase domain-containing protein [Anaerolineaceae bacterium]